jgi:hypothetical protein
MSLTHSNLVGWLFSFIEFGGIAIRLAIKAVYGIR